MEGVKIKKDGFIGWSYKWLRGYTILPISFCKVFWTTILSWVCMTILLPGLLLTLLSKTLRKETNKYGIFVTLFINIFLAGAVAIILGLYNFEYSYTNILNYLIVIGVVLGFVALVTGVIYVISVVYNWIGDYIFEYRMKRMTSGKITKMSTKSKRSFKLNIKTPEWLKTLTSFLRIGFDSFINKYCPKTDWY